MAVDVGQRIRTVYLATLNFVRCRRYGVFGAEDIVTEYDGGLDLATELASVTDTRVVVIEAVAGIRSSDACGLIHSLVVVILWVLVRHLVDGRVRVFAVLGDRQRGPPQRLVYRGLVRVGFGELGAPIALQ